MTFNDSRFQQIRDNVKAAVAALDDARCDISDLSQGNWTPIAYRRLVTMQSSVDEAIRRSLNVAEMCGWFEEKPKGAA